MSDTSAAYQNAAQSTWHVDRTINLATAVGFVGAIASGIWFAAGMTARIETLEKQMQIAAPLSERIIRLEIKMDGVGSTLQEIKAIVRTPMNERR